METETAKVGVLPVEGSSEATYSPDDALSTEQKKKKIEDAKRKKKQEELCTHHEKISDELERLKAERALIALDLKNKPEWVGDAARAFVPYIPDMLLKYIPFTNPQLKMNGIAKKLGKEQQGIDSAIKKIESEIFGEKHVDGKESGGLYGRLYKLAEERVEITETIDTIDSLLSDYSQIINGWKTNRTDKDPQNRRKNYYEYLEAKKDNATYKRTKAKYQLELNTKTIELRTLNNAVAKKEARLEQLMERLTIFGDLQGDSAGMAEEENYAVQDIESMDRVNTLAENYTRLLDKLGENDNEVKETLSSVKRILDETTKNIEEKCGQNETAGLSYSDRAEAIRENVDKDPFYDLDR